MVQLTIDEIYSYSPIIEAASGAAKEGHAVRWSTITLSRGGAMLGSACAVARAAHENL